MRGLDPSQPTTERVTRPRLWTERCSDVGWARGLASADAGVGELVPGESSPR